jgi:hypothetical protein
MTEPSKRDTIPAEPPTEPNASPAPWDWIDPSRETKAQTAVLDVKSALHNWRAEPSPECFVKLSGAVNELCVLTLELERQCEAEP